MNITLAKDRVRITFDPSNSMVTIVHYWDSAGEPPPLKKITSILLVLEILKSLHISQKQIKVMARRKPLIVLSDFISTQAVNKKFYSGGNCIKLIVNPLPDFSHWLNQFLPEGRGFCSSSTKNSISSRKISTLSSITSSETLQSSEFSYRYLAKKLFNSLTLLSFRKSNTTSAFSSFGISFLRRASASDSDIIDFAKLHFNDAKQPNIKSLRFCIFEKVVLSKAAASAASGLRKADWTIVIPLILK